MCIGIPGVEEMKYLNVMNMQLDFPPLTPENTRDSFMC